MNTVLMLFVFNFAGFNAQVAPMAQEDQVVILQGFANEYQCNHEKEAMANRFLTEFHGNEIVSGVCLPTEQAKAIYGNFEVEEVMGGEPADFEGAARLGDVFTAIYNLSKPTHPFIVIAVER